MQGPDSIEQLTGYGSSAHHDSPKKPPSGQGDFRGLQNSLWLVPVLRYLITVSGDSVQVEADPVVSLLPVILPTIASWWFDEQRVINLMHHRHETVVGDPYLFNEVATDMDGGTVHKNTANNKQSTNTREYSGYENPEKSNDKEADKNNEDSDGNGDKYGEGTLASEVRTAKKNIQQMLIEKIKAGDEISVFCLLHYSEANPNIPYQGLLPIDAALEVNNENILQELLDHGLHLEHDYSAISVQPSWVQMNIYTRLLPVVMKAEPDSTTVSRLKLLMAANADCLLLVRDLNARTTDFFWTYYGLSVLSIFFTHKWECFPEIMKIALSHISSKYSVTHLALLHDLFKMHVLVFVRLNRRAVEERAPVVYMGFVHNLSDSGICFILEISQNTFELSDISFMCMMLRWGNAPLRVQHFLNLLLKKIDDHRNTSDGLKLQLILFSNPFNEMLGYWPAFRSHSCERNALIKEKQLFSQELRKNYSLINDIHINGLPLLNYVTRHDDFSEVFLFHLLDFGLIPIFRNTPEKDLTNYDNFQLLSVISLIQQRCKDHRLLSYLCFERIISSLRRGASYSALLLPVNLFQKIFGSVYYESTSAEHKRIVLSRHFRINPTFHCDEKALQEIKEGLKEDCAVYIGYTEVIIHDPNHAVQELWDELLDICSDEDIHECYSDECIRQLELEVEKIVSD